MSRMGYTKPSSNRGSEGMPRKVAAVVAANDPLGSQPFRPSLELTFRGHRSSVLAVGFQPSASSLLDRRTDASDTTVPPYALSCGSDGLVFLWSAKATVRALRFVGHRGPVHDCAWSPHAHLIASAGHDGFIRLWLPSLRRTGGLAAPSVSSYGGENSVLWRAHAGPVRALAFAPHDDHLYTAGDDKAVKCWDLNYASSSSSATSTHGKSCGNKFVCGFTGGHQNWVRTVAVSNGSGSGNGILATRVPLIASGGDDRTVHVWDPRSRRPTHTFFEHTDSVRSVDFHPDGCSLATGSADHTINVFDLRRNRLLQHYDAHDGAVNEVRFAPTGSWLLSASADGAAKLWDLKEGFLYCTLNAHEGAVHTARFSDNGACFTTAGQDGIVMVWRSGLPCVQPSYATYPNTHLYVAEDAPTRPLLPEGATAPLPEDLPRDLVPSSTSSPRVGTDRRRAASGAVAIASPNDFCCSIETSADRAAHPQQELPKTNGTETEPKSQGHLPLSMTSSQFSVFSQKPPLAQPSSRSGGSGPAAPVAPLQEDHGKKDEGGCGSNQRLAQRGGRNSDSGKSLAFGREENERRYPIYKSPRVSEEYNDWKNDRGIDTNKNNEKCGLDQERQNNQQYPHDAVLASIEHAENNTDAGAAKIEETDEEVSVVEYVGKTYDEVAGDGWSNGSMSTPHGSHQFMTHSKEQNQNYPEDRVGRLEKVCARLMAEVQIAQERNSDLAQQLNERWDAQQLQQRSEIDQLRQMMEGLVVQQSALLQALRKE